VPTSLEACIKAKSLVQIMRTVWVDMTELPANFLKAGFFNPHTFLSDIRPFGASLFE
jgi:hypothetical protein